MKQIITLFLVLTLTVITSCRQNQDNNKPFKKELINAKTVTNSNNTKQQNHYFDTTFVVNKKTFKFVIKDINEDEVALTFIRDSKNIKSDTLYSVGLGAFEFTDFNKDGNLDILFTYIGNNSSYDIYLFDNKTDEFKKIDGFDRFPDAIQLKVNPKYYYSYHRAGCADMNWVSDLFYIDNFKTIQIGHIYGQGCDFNEKENPQMIEIYKILENEKENEKLIEKFSYLKNISKFGDKWSFIEEYWNSNYGKFN
jgi:hypothetical protein